LERPWGGPALMVKLPLELNNSHRYFWRHFGGSKIRMTELQQFGGVPSLILYVIKMGAGRLGTKGLTNVRCNAIELCG
jgi:hypothetical protein